MSKMELQDMFEMMALLVAVAGLAVLGSLANMFGADSRDFATRVREHSNGGN